jgi:hypothetical protein
MRKYNKLILVGGAVAALAVLSAVMADAPSGVVFNPGQGLTAETAGTSRDQAILNQDNLNAWGASAIIQNGQFVSGKATGAPDWQHQKSTRSDQVHADLAQSGRGSLG